MISEIRREQLKAANKKWRQTKKTDYNNYQNKYTFKLRTEVLSHYGSACACCGEKTFRFLTIDHKNSNGAEHRKVIGSGGNRLMLYLKRNNYPQDDYQCLCWNCDCGRQLNNGICPHKEA